MAEQQPNKVILEVERPVFGIPEKAYVTVNAFANMRGHGMITSARNERQRLGLRFLRLMLDIAKDMPESSFWFNSIGANASAGLPHSQFLPNQPLPIDGLEMDPLMDADGIKAGMIRANENMPVSGYMISY